jgi:hypothetical protein
MILPDNQKLSWLGAALNRRGTFVSRLSRAFNPSTIASLSGPEA